MADDLAPRLREWAQAPMYALISRQLVEAADALAEQAETIERLRAALKQIADEQGDDFDLWAIDIARTALAADDPASPVSR